MATGPELGSKSKDVVWYRPAIPVLSEPVQDLLENYSHYAHDEVITRVLEIRDQMWDIFPWPCVGCFTFLDLSLSQHDDYASILDRLKHGAIFLDVGCCIAQDLRKLVHDGALAKNLFGLEPQADFLSLATHFFRDGDRLPAEQFIHSDFMDRGNVRLRELEGKVDIIQLGLVLHLWDWDEQIEACKRVVELLRSESESVIVGQTVGNLAGMKAPIVPGKIGFHHNVETFMKMWREVGRATGTKWDVQANLDEESGPDAIRWGDARWKVLAFTIQRL
ncbi:hypothetical protein C8A05DRAFT_48312 [Staphylotrichum tortipilum]|uniref:Methyltransferase domain-containing protein n=1 Tax=Staphylotrichum tortipilum TaxID=2831512 RepID=A0AAN6RMD4_9PEZI|nr:hypothetical protein C8A05DRAFT_48312 [Staphylotrichum longicolle]